MVPKEARSDSQGFCDDRASARAEFSKRQPIARRISHGKDNALLDGHDAQVALAKTKAEARARARAAQERDSRARTDPRKRRRSKSRKRRREEAFKARGALIDRRSKSHVARYAQKLRELGQWDAAPQRVPAFVWRRAQLIQADPSGYAARVFLATLPPAVARRIWSVALEPAPYAPSREREDRELFKPSGAPLKGHPARWERPGRRYVIHPAAIRTIAAGCVLWHLGVPTRHKGFGRVVRGFPRRMIAALLQDPASGHRPAITTLYGHRRGVPGAVRALEGKLFYVNQPPGDKVRPCDRGPSGHAFNVYWIYPWLLREGSAPSKREQLAAEQAEGILRELDLTKATGPPEATT